MKDFAHCVSLGVWGITALLLTARPVVAQDDLEDWQVEEMATLVMAIVDTRASARAPDEGAIQFLPSYMQGAEGITYVPFTLLIDQSALEAEDMDLDDESIVAYVAMTEPTDAAPSPEADLPEPVFENGFYSEIERSSSEPIRVERALQAEAGEYDLYVAVRGSFDGDAPRERSLNPRTGQVEEMTVVPPVTIFKERITVPDLWNDEVQTSTIFLTESVEPLTEPPTEEQLALFPYTIGGARITPKLDSTFGTDGVLGFVFMVYNVDHDDGMPDVTIEYEFHTQTADGEDFFNRTDPQVMSSQTLPPGFDLRQGFQLVTGQNIPLGSFPPADYRLEVKVTDNEGDNEVSQELFFTVEN